MSVMDSLKKEINEQTGIPVDMLTGDTPEAVVSSAKKIMQLKAEHEQSRPKSTREQFAEYMGERFGNNEKSAPNLDDLIPKGYPCVKDGGELDARTRSHPDGRPAREQFADWMRRNHPKRNNGNLI